VVPRRTVSVENLSTGIFSVATDVTSRFTRAVALDQEIQTYLQRQFLGSNRVDRKPDVSPERSNAERRGAEITQLNADITQGIYPVSSVNGNLVLGNFCKL